MPLKRVVLVLELFAVLAAAAFVVMLLVYKGSGSGATSVGAQLFSTNCASCHGANAQGGLGPKLAGQVTKDFPNEADQIAFVKRGKGAMPSFAGDLTDDQIKQIVEYTRSLGG